MRQDANDRPSQRTARMRHLLAAVAVAAALCVSVTLADVSQHQPSSGTESGSHPAAATVVRLTSFSVPVSFTVGISPVAVLNKGTRSQALGRVIGRLNQLLAARHLYRREVGLVQVFASGPIAEIPRSQRAAHYVLDSLQRHDLKFAQAAGQSYWMGSGNCFVFHVYFLS